MRFKPWCSQCGHSAACHGTSRWGSSFLILLTIAALLMGSLVWFGNPRHTATAAADDSASVAGQPAVKD